MPNDNQNNEIASRAGRPLRNSGTSRKQAEKTISTITAREKICVAVSISAIILAILNSLGLITGLPEFLDSVQTKRPETVLWFMCLFIVVSTVVLDGFIPRKFRALAWLPASAFLAFWLNKGWLKLIEYYGSVISENSITFIHLATLMLGFCLACHATFDGKKMTLSGKSLVFMGMALFANFAALVLTFMSAGFVSSLR